MLRKRICQIGENEGLSTHKQNALSHHALVFDGRVKERKTIKELNKKSQYRMLRCRN